MRTQIVITIILAAGMAGCADNGSGGEDLPFEATQLRQVGSSTVFPIAEAWAEELAARTGGHLQVTVAGGGSGRGASAICAGEADIGDMSRPLKESEIEDCRANGVEPVEWKVAFDGLTVVVNPSNTFVDHLSVEELRHIWRADDPARTWADVREGWPAEPILLFGPDSDSGTYEYFNEAILEGSAPRNDYTPSPRDEILVEGVANEPYAIGHFGFAYYSGSEDRLKAVPILDEGASAPVAPSFETIADGSYSPLGRPIFMVTDGAPEPGTALHHYFSYAMGDGQQVVRDVGYVELDQATLDEQRARLG